MPDRNYASHYSKTSKRKHTKEMSNFQAQIKLLSLFHEADGPTMSHARSLMVSRCRSQKLEDHPRHLLFLVHQLQISKATSRQLNSASLLYSHPASSIITLQDPPLVYQRVTSTLYQPDPTPHFFQRFPYSNCTQLSNTQLITKYFEGSVRLMRNQQIRRSWRI